MKKQEKKYKKSIPFDLSDFFTKLKIPMQLKKNPLKKRQLLLPALLLVSVFAIILIVLLLRAQRTVIVLDSRSLEMLPGEVYTFSVDGLPKKHDASELNWSSSNPEVASVENGILKANAAGGAVITASFGKAEVSCDVEVILKGYVQIDGDHYFYFDDGSFATTEWVEIDGVKKWFQTDGKEIVPTRMIAFTFDDGPTPYTEDVLKVLKSYGSTGTFFQCGYEVADHAEVEKMIIESGSEIGSHTWDHVSLDKLSGPDIQATLQKTSDEIFKYSGERPALLRPPYGAVSQTVKDSAGIPLIMWNITDEGLYDESYILTANAILRNPQDGDIALMHDSHAYCIDTVKYAIPILIQNGFRVVSVSELAEAKGVDLKNGYQYFTITGAE